MTTESRELLGCFLPNGERTQESVERTEVYDGNGKAANKIIGGVVNLIFDVDSQIVLVKRSAKKEQAAGRIAPPSEHVRFSVLEIPDQIETPIHASHRCAREELGVLYNDTNFLCFNSNFPVSSIKLPRTNWMLVFYCSSIISPTGIERLRNNDLSEADSIFLEPWSTARLKFLANDYELHGLDNDKPVIIAALDKWLVSTLGNYSL